MSEIQSKLHIVLHIKYGLVSSDFVGTWIFPPTYFQKKYSTIIFHENPSSGAELFHVDGRAHMNKLIAVFRNVANATKILMTGSYGKWVKGYGLDSALCVTLWTRQ